MSVLQLEEGHEDTKQCVSGFRPTCTCSADDIPSLVLDPFGGAGTTALCAYHQGRRCVLIELSPEYCELAKERLEAEMAQLRIPETLPPAEVPQAQQPMDTWPDEEEAQQ